MLQVIKNQWQLLLSIQKQKLLLKMEKQQCIFQQKKCHLEVLKQAILQSLDVIAAWDNDKLVGLIRVVGDGLTIMYIQDILILNAYQNKGIASELLQQMLIKYNNVRQKVLLTEEASDVRHFYEKNGFESCDQGSLVAFAKMN